MPLAPELQLPALDHTDVTLRDPSDHRGLYRRTVLTLAHHDAEVRLAWPDARTLLVEYRGQVAGTPRTDWDGVSIEYRPLP